MNDVSTAPPGRAERRRQRNRQALIEAGHAVMAEKGIDAATMLEIADRADVGAGTVYSYFDSKEALAIAVLEALMHDLGLRIEQVTDGFEDPAQVYAYGVRTVIDTAACDLRWKQLLNRSEVMADAMFRKMGPFATRDMTRATRAGRFRIDNVAISFRMACFAIVGVSLAIARGDADPAEAEDATVGILCMSGLPLEEARDLARRDRPPLPDSPA